jgi:hypothetical protein
MNLVGRKLSLERRGLAGVVIAEAKTVISNFNCEATAVVGDVVHVSEFDNNTVITNVDNLHSRPTIGILIEKLSATECKVLTHGKWTQSYLGLEKGKKVFLSVSGSLTTTPPNTGYVQVVGLCYEEDKIFVNPSKERVKRTI